MNPANVYTKFLDINMHQWERRWRDVNSGYLLL